VKFPYVLICTNVENIFATFVVAAEGGQGRSTPGILGRQDTARRGSQVLMHALREVYPANMLINVDEVHLFSRPIGEAG
jgi:hypothetical protein